MVSENPEQVDIFAASDRHELRRMRMAAAGRRFTHCDAFEGVPSDPLHMHKYLYAGANPVMNNDPSGNDFSLAGTLTTTGILAGLGASLGVGINGINNYAVGRRFFDGAGSAAAFGAAGLPLSVAFPIVGLALAGLGLYASGSTAYQVFTTPGASVGQKAASAFLVGLSIFGAYGAASNASGGSLWVNTKYFSSAGTSASSNSSYQAALDNVRNYTEALKSSLDGTPQAGRVTLGVGIAEDAMGNRFTLVGTSEPAGYVRPQVRSTIYGWGGIVVTGTGHAEADIVAYAAARGWNLVGVGATRPICVPCAQEIAASGATAATPLK